MANPFDPATEPDEHAAYAHAASLNNTHKACLLYVARTTGRDDLLEEPNPRPADPETGVPVTEPGNYVLTTNEGRRGDLLELRDYQARAAALRDRGDSPLLVEPVREREYTGAVMPNWGGDA